MKPDKPTSGHKPLIKKTLEKNFQVEYLFVPSKEAELRVLQAYEMVFEEIDKIVLREKGYEQNSANN
jgi:hypothetical protein